MQLRWSEQLSVGDETIDAQHRVLIKRVSALEAALRRGDLGELARMFRYLGDYALTHFEDEERIMRIRAYPGYLAHNAAHIAFVGRFLELERELREAGQSEEVALRVLAWLGSWLDDHLAGEDRELGNFLREGAGAPLPPPFAVARVLTA